LAPPPPPVLPVSIASNSTNNIEHGSMNTSQEQTKKKKEQKKIEDLGDQVVPQAKRGIKRPVIEHNGFDDYYRSRLDAPIFRYTNSNNNNNNNNKNSHNNVDRQTSGTNVNGSQIDLIVIE